MEDKIKILEEELRLAMINNDADKLDELIDDSLVFIGPDGSVATKEDDLAAHRAKIQLIQEINPSQTQIVINEGFVVVILRAAIAGSFSGVSISGDYRYLRVWKQFGDTFRIIAGSVSSILE